MYVPILCDILYHYLLQITTDYNLENDCSECFALKNFQAKEQVRNIKDVLYTKNPVICYRQWISVHLLCNNSDKISDFFGDICL